MKRLLTTLSAGLASLSAFAATSTVPMHSAGDAATAAAHRYSFSSFLPLIIIIALFYFMFFLPQRRRQKQLNQMVASLEKGAEVLMNSGIVGTVQKVGDAYIDVEVSKDVVVKMQKTTVAQVLPKGSIKSL